MAEQNIKLTLSPAPHIKDKATGFSMMVDTILALIPATVAGIVLFGMKAIFPIAISMITAILSELLMLKMRGKKAVSADIGSAVLTGLVLSLTLPPGIPWYAVITGAAVSIIVAKHFLGGLGYNIFNPALVGRAFLMAAWPLLMTTWIAPFSKIDVVTSATPLALNKAHESIGLLKMLLGLHAGSIGETCAIALLLGGLYLLLRRTIEWRIPLGFIGSAVITALMFRQDPTFHVLAGGMLLGSLFMATDPVTSPVTKQGRWVFGISCGVITMIIRFLGGYPEGVAYAILIMNATVPLLDRYLRGRAFGEARS